MMRAVIVDDEINARETLGIMLKMYAPEIEVIAEADGVKSGLQVINSNQPDLLFLDIQMGDGSGFDLLSYFSSYPFKVIFVTAYEEYALKAFKFSALDYLVKPVTPDDLIRAVGKVKETSATDSFKSQMDVLELNYENKNKPPEKIILKTLDAIYVVEVKEIIRCESDDNYTKFYLEEGNKLMVSKTLKEFDEMLGTAGFLRVHQSHLININQIDHLVKKDGGMLIMKDKSEVPVASRKKDQLLKQIQQLGF